MVNKQLQLLDMIGVQIAPFLLMHGIFIYKQLYLNYYCYMEKKLWLKIKKNKKYFIWVLDSNHNTLYYNILILYPLHQQLGCSNQKIKMQGYTRCVLHSECLPIPPLMPAKKAPRNVIFKYLKLLVRVRLNGSDELLLLSFFSIQNLSF